MTNVHFLSDLHLDFGALKEHRAPEGTEVVILGGDTHPGVLGIIWAQQTFDVPVLYLPGNHEYYGRRAIDKHPRKMREKAAGSHVHVVDRDTMVLAGTRFICATLWTDYNLFGDQPLAMMRAETGMNDYARICQTLSRPLRPVHLLKEHHLSRAFIEAELAKPFDGPTVVLTHHAPTPVSVAKGLEQDPLTPCYASDLTALLFDDNAPELWLHGHVHQTFDYEIGHTRIRSNPRGYWENGKNQNPEFDQECLVKVEKRPSPAPGL